MINKCILIGRLAGEPQIKQAGETTVVNFSLAVDRNFKNADGKKEVDFIPIVVWRKTAEIVAKYCNKGSQVAITGRIQVRNYEKDGKKVYVTEVVAEEVQLLGHSQSTEKKAVEGFEEIELNLPF